MAREVVTAEERVAQSLTRLRTEAGLTYEGLAHRLMGMGIRIHPSAIQKTEKSGRKPTIKEMVAYARVFKVPVQSLWGGAEDESNFSSAMRDLAAAERLLGIVRFVQGEYDTLITNVGDEVESNPQLRTQLVNDMSNAVLTQIMDELRAQDNLTGPNATDASLPSLHALDAFEVGEILDEKVDGQFSTRLATLTDVLYPALRQSIFSATTSSATRSRPGIRSDARSARNNFHDGEGDWSTGGAADLGADPKPQDVLTSIDQAFQYLVPNIRALEYAQAELQRMLKEGSPQESNIDESARSRASKQTLRDAIMAATSGAPWPVREKRKAPQSDIEIHGADLERSRGAKTWADGEGDAVAEEIEAWTRRTPTVGDEADATDLQLPEHHEIPGPDNDFDGGESIVSS